jgi:hypothetical protein
LKNHQELILKEYTKEEVDLFYYQEKHDVVPSICSLLGFFILVFCLLVFIYAPVKTIATYGIIVDIPGFTVTQKAKISNLLVLLDDGKTVRVRMPPKWFNFSKSKTVILQERTSMFFGIKRYSFYNNVI